MFKLAALALFPAAMSGSAIITNGFYDLTFGFGQPTASFQFMLSDGFTLSGGSNVVPSAPTGCYLSFGPCLISSYSGLQGMNEFDAPETFDYGPLGIAAAPASAILTGLPAQTLTTAFAAEGTIYTPALRFLSNPAFCDLATPDAFPSDHVCSENISGHGVETVTVNFHPGGPYGGYFLTDTVHVAFQSPEPSTFLLIGAAALAFRRRLSWRLRN